MNLLTALFAGGLFGAGLVVSQMTNADKVINFLNVAGDWDPSLALVMVGAIGVHVVLFRFILRRPSPLYATAFALPTSEHIDGKLVGGAALFGVGWALGGFCPGPAVVSMPSGGTHALVFVGAMALGMGAWRGVQSLTTPSPNPRVTSDQPEGRASNIHG